jgi:hypothetical protein
VQRPVSGNTITPARKIQNHRKQRIKPALIVLGDWSLLFCDQCYTHRRGICNETGQAEACRSH